MGKIWELIQTSVNVVSISMQTMMKKKELSGPFGK